MNLSNDGLVAFHYRFYGTFFLQQNRLHNIHRGFIHYKYYRALILVINFKLYSLYVNYISNLNMENTNKII